MSRSRLAHSPNSPRWDGKRSSTTGDLLTTDLRAEILNLRSLPSPRPNARSQMPIWSPPLSHVPLFPLLCLFTPFPHSFLAFLPFLYFLDQCACGSCLSQSWSFRSDSVYTTARKGILVRCNFASNSRQAARYLSPDCTKPQTSTPTRTRDSPKSHWLLTSFFPFASYIHSLATFPNGARITLKSSAEWSCCLAQTAWHA